MGQPAQEGGALPTIPWERLVALEPRLEAVRAYAAALKGDAEGGFCATEAWDDVAVHLAYVVGPDRQRDPAPLGHMVAQRWEELRRGLSPAEVFGPADFVLRAQAALDVAAATVRAAIPPCQGCDCGGY